MFSTLRQNTPFYVLHKGNPFTLEIGQVADVTSPTPRYTNLSSTFQQEMVVDILVKTESSNYKFEKVPANATITDSGTNTVISEDRLAIINEIENCIRKSKEALEAVPSHEKLIAEGEVMLQKLNPQIAKDKKHEEDINNLKSEMSDIKGTLSNIVNILNNLKKED